MRAVVLNSECRAEAWGGVGGTYKGNYHRGKAHGTGFRQFANGNKYDGEFVMGHMCGEGIYTTFTSDVYVGEMRDDRFHGNGVMNYVYGDRYEGQWQRGMPYGKGKYTYADGGFYEGEYLAVLDHYRHGVVYPCVNGKRHGKGVRVWASGNRYEGDWAEDKMEGKGTIKYANGDTYKGHFHLGCRSGYGIMYYGPGDGTPYTDPMGYRQDGRGRCKYEGAWKNDWWHGKGTYEAADGRSYVGQWRRGLRHGEGEYHFVPDVERGDASRYWSGGTDGLYRPYSYKGAWEDGYREGKGKVVYCNGIEIEGNFERAVMGGGIVTGKARVIYPKDGKKRWALFDHCGVRQCWLDDEPDSEEEDAGRGGEPPMPSVFGGLMSALTADGGILIEDIKLREQEAAAAAAKK